MHKLICTAVFVAMCALCPGGMPYAGEQASREVRFANPPATSRILPIHHIRPDDIGKAEREMEDIIADGFGGFVGNVNFNNYLDSPQSWQTYHHVVRYAHSRGLVHWLYDEKGYPSCMAGGKTLEGHPQWQARAYLIAVTNVPAGSAVLPPTPPGRHVATLRRPRAEGMGETVFVITDAYIHEGTHAACSVSRDKHLYPNLLMAEPTARFIEITHAAYARELGTDLACVTSTFTDEPSLMAYWFRSMPYLCLPVSDELIAAYAKEAGHPLAEDVPELVTGPAAGAVAAIRHRYWSMVGARVAQNYIGQLTQWCTAHGIESGGHLLGEESLVAHVPLYGDFFRVLRRLSAPSCDILTSVPEQVPWITPLLAGSAAALNGAKYAMSEASDHHQRWRKEGDTRPKYQVTVREVVGSLNRQIWGGINTFTSYYDWRAFPRAERCAINAEIGRTLALFREGDNAAEIALLYPADTLMTGYEPRLHRGGGVQAQRTAGLVNTVGQGLYAANRAFMFTDAAALVAAKIDGGALTHGKLRWRTVILAGVTTLPLEAVRALEKFRLAGGLVIVVGDRPVNSTQQFPSADVTRITANWMCIPANRSILLADFLATCHTPALMRTRGPENALRTGHRHTAAGDVFFVMNDTPEPWCGAVQLAGGGAAKVWNPRNGLTFTASGEIPLELMPYAGVLLTTDGRIDGTRTKDTSAAFKMALTPLSAQPNKVTLSKGTYVTSDVRPLTNGWTRVETTLTKGGVDTFAFLCSAYSPSPFTTQAKGVGFTVRVPADTLGEARCGIFISTKDGSRWYTCTDAVLSKKGVCDVFSPFVQFSPHGPRGSKPMRLRPENIISVQIGYGGYYGRAGERVTFEVSPPQMLTF